MTKGVYPHKPISEEVKKKISFTLKGKKKPIRTLIHRKNLSLSMKGKTGPNKGKIFSEKWKEKLSLSGVGNKNAHGKLGKIYKRKNYPNSYRHRNTQYKEWRLSVFKRDNYTCQNCGIKGGYLEAHHIKKWTDYPNLRLEKSNGLTLCLNCHKLTNNYKNRKHEKV